MIKRMEIPKLVLFGVKCFNCDTTKLCFRNSPAWNKDDILIPMFIGTPCIYIFRFNGTGRNKLTDRTARKDYR